LAFPSAARCESWLSAGANLAGDDQRYRWDDYQLGFRRESDADGQRVALRFHTYSLEQPYAGIAPFDGSEPAVELGGHVLLDEVLWLGLSLGLQGSADLDGVVGELVAGRAFATGWGTFTPRVELAREPLTRTALPLSLGLHDHRAEGVLAWRTTGWTAEGGVRGDFWEGDTVPGRVQNAALDTIPETRVITVHAYLLSDREHWLEAGVSAKAAWSSRTTLLPTAIAPVRLYTWYPASAPPALWETALIVRAEGALAEPLHASLQVQLPALSQETRQWETVRQTDWGTGPFEARLALNWLMFPSTSLQFGAMLFAKPWRRWDVLSAGAYRMIAAGLTLEQRI
jgi:hypothetical protein